MSRPKYEYRTGSKESFYQFKKNFPEIKITYDVFLKILKIHASYFASHILETGDLLKLPYGMGTLTVAKYKKAAVRYTKKKQAINNLPPDWAKTHQLWKECEECKEKKQMVFHLNNHTEGYSYYWRWNINKVTIKSPYIWSFSMNREFSRGLSKLLLSQNSKYKNLYKTFHKSKK